jgi:hypothetical protein
MPVVEYYRGLNKVYEVRGSRFLILLFLPLSNFSLMLP